ncbi:MAG: TonB-dependent receptor [Flavobacteriales bacterium]
MNKLLLSFFMILFATYSISQGMEVTGSVKDVNGEALIGANVYVKSSSNVATSTNVEGMYTLKLENSGNVTLVASYLGYSSQTKEVSASGTVDFVLNSDALGLSESVVTGVVNSKSKLESSVSVTTMDPKAIQESSARTTAELLRSVPGIRSESSGGEGNTNITARGVPISAGGSKFLQLQEDGLPIFLFGDIAFATSDIFLRADANVGRIEAIRGGSASTLASNSPAGIVNFISKTGSVEGGSISSTFGLDYNSYRTDFEYGGPLGNGFNFHVGGFFRSGEGPRSAGYTANNGGQVKANLTKYFDKGYARIYVKHLNDRTAAYMPMPVQVTGTNAKPTWESAPNFSATLGGLQSAYLQSNTGLGPDGGRRSVDVRDGMRPLSNSIGAEFKFDLGDGWKFESRSRLSSNSGRFVAPFTAAVGETPEMLDVIGGAIGRDLSNALLTTAHNNEPFTGDLAQVIHMFDTELTNLNNFVSDSKISKQFDDLTVDLGYFRGQQNINKSWLWNSYLMEVGGDDAALINIADVSSGIDTVGVSESGLFAYGVPVWDCCNVQYNSSYNISAPYAALGFDATDDLNIDASVRYDLGRVRGEGYGGAQAEIDVNNDGVISPAEESVATINLAQPNPVNYDYDYLSYSLGANYKLGENNAVFARYSHGASAKADRAIFPTASYLENNTPIDLIDQAEIGYKHRFEKGGLFITAFYAQTDEQGGFEATTQEILFNSYQALGLELEGAYSNGNFDLRGGFTFTDAEITEEGGVSTAISNEEAANDPNLTANNVGNTSRRQPMLMYSIMPSYRFSKGAIGLSVIGQTDSYAQNNNELVMTGFAVINGFVRYDIKDGLAFSVNGNNILDTIGITESEEGSIVEGEVNYLRARSVTGRSLTCSLTYTF